MKKIKLILFFILVSTSLLAQNRDTKVADQLFDRFEYVQAVQEYLTLVEKERADGYVNKQLGDCYYNMYNTKEAEKWYAQAITSNQDAETYYRYAQMLKSNSKYELANVQMKIFAAKSPKDQRAIEFSKNPDYLPKLIDKEKLFDVTVLDINSDKSDFGAVLYNDVVYFASARNESEKNYGWNDEPFLDLYQAAYNADGTYSKPTPIAALNSKFHEGPLTMSKDGNTIYFSSESFNEKLFEKDKSKKLKYGQVGLFKAVKANGEWSDITPLPFNSKSYSTSNPRMNSDDNMLYFSSNMPGSIGGYDIWKVKINNNGSYGKPENLGDKINTPGDEGFPFITNDNILYFASNGLTGFGGLDIFSADLNKNTLPINIGKPVNTEKDDFAFTFNKEKNSGYLSSNRSGDDNIYASVPVCEAQIVTVVKNSKTGVLLANARVVILDDKNNVIETKMSNDKGEVVYDVECQKAYAIEVYKDGFVTKSFPVANIKSGKVTIDASIDPIDVIITDTEIILNPIYFEYDKSNITKQGAAELDKLVYVMSQNDKLVIYAKSHTDSRGSDKYNLDLSERRAKSTVQYVISKGISANRITGNGFGESQPKVDCKNKCTDAEYALNRRSEFLLVK
jgi:outer membrane protein OmpA-like peptidoglycan-associated protein